MKTTRVAGVEYPAWRVLVAVWSCAVGLGVFWVGAIPYMLGNRSLAQVFLIVSGVFCMVGLVFGGLMSRRYHSVTGRWRWWRESLDDAPPSPPLPPPPP